MHPSIDTDQPEMFVVTVQSIQQKLLKCPRHVIMVAAGDFCKTYIRIRKSSSSMFAALLSKKGLAEVSGSGIFFLINLQKALLQEKSSSFFVT